MHFLQSKYWKECKRSLGNQVYDVGGYFFQTTTLPLIGKTVGYMPRPDLTKINWEELHRKAKEAKCVYVTIDPENLISENATLPSQYQFKSGIPVHLQENTAINLTISDEELLASMKQKHRYNLNLAHKKGVEVKISDSEDAFAEFLKLYEATVIRQGYHGRSKEYITTVWNSLKSDKIVTIATAYFQGKPLASWLLFLYEEVIYYPYGGSSDEFKNVMAPYALVWEIIQWGKQNGFKSLDLWGIKSVGKSESGEIIYDGFSRFKVGFGGRVINYAETVDFIIEPFWYKLFQIAARARQVLIFR